MHFWCNSLHRIANYEHKYLLRLSSNFVTSVKKVRMHENQPRQNSFNEYLKSVEKQEKVKKRKFLLLTGGVSILLLVLFLNYLQNHFEKDDSVPLRELNPERVRMLLSHSPDGIFIRDEKLGIEDTLYTLGDYQNLVNLYPEIGVDMDSITIVESPETFTSLEESIPEINWEEESLDPIQLKIEGDLQVGNKLHFIIPNFDDAHIYLIDHGDEEIVKMSIGHEYAYENPGEYEIKITVISTEIGAQLDYSRSITIRSAQDLPEEDYPIVKEKSSSLRDFVERKIPAEQPDRLPLPVSEEVLSSPKDSPLREISMEQESEPRQVVKISPPTGEEPLGDEAYLDVPKISSRQSPLDFATKMPSFPGGISKMTRFLNKQLKYPDLAREYEIQGIVYIQFVVGPDGSLSEFRVARGIGYGCDEEAIRMARSMPKWNPGEHEGQRVPVKFTIPVNFSLQ